MVGGHAPQAEKVLYRFIFPERPWGTHEFPHQLRSDWNISLPLPQSRPDFGRVLVGMQVPPADKAAFQDFLECLRLRIREETANQHTGCFLAE